MEDPGGDAAQSCPVVRLEGALDFMRLLWAVDQGLRGRSKKMEASLGLTGPQRLVLRITGRFPGISAGSLADVLHLHPSTLTGVISRLEARRLLERRNDPRDARRSLFLLTPQGEALDRQHDGTIEAAVRKALSTLKPRQLDATRQVLMLLAKELSPPGEL